MSCRPARTIDLVTRWLVVLTTGTLGLGSLQPIAAQVRRVQDTFTATTVDMTPAGLALRMQVLAWSDDSGRADVIAAIEAADLAALAKLPTVGYIWPTDSPVGYSVKYAQKAPSSGGERITLVTDKPLGGYDYRKWSVAGASAKPEAGYSVIELTVDSAGNGTGTTSLAAEVVLDSTAGTVSLAAGGPTLLTQVHREPAH
jgi:hypothetical protein